MTNFAKGTAFFIFGVLLSPILGGMLAPIVAWNLTESHVIAVVVTIVTFSAWAIAREYMIARKWHYHL